MHLIRIFWLIFFEILFYLIEYLILVDLFIFIKTLMNNIILFLIPKLMINLINIRLVFGFLNFDALFNMSILKFFIFFNFYVILIKLITFGNFNWSYVVFYLSMKCLGSRKFTFIIFDSPKTLFTILLSTIFIILNPQ